MTIFLILLFVGIIGAIYTFYIYPRWLDKTYLKELVLETDAGSKKEIIDIGYTSVDTSQYDWCKPNVVFFGELAPLYGDMYDILDSLTVQDLVILVGCSNQVINFNPELFAAARHGTKVIVINPQIGHFEETQYEERGILTYRTGSVDAFSNQKLIETVEKHLEG